MAKRKKIVRKNYSKRNTPINGLSNRKSSIYKKKSPKKNTGKSVGKSKQPVVKKALKSTKKQKKSSVNAQSSSLSTHKKKNIIYRGKTRTKRHEPTGKVRRLKTKSQPISPKGKGKKHIPTPKRKPTRYLRIQSVLSAYTRKNNIRLGRLFSKKVSELYNRTKDYSLSYLKANIESIYSEYLVPLDINKEFAEFIPFWNFSNEVLNPIYEGVLIRVYFKDQMEEYKKEGYPELINNWFRSEGLYAHLRANYEASPSAMFVMDGTDNRTYVNYIVSIGGFTTHKQATAIFEKESGLDTSRPKDPTLPPESDKKESVVPMEKKLPSTAEEEIMLSQERQRELQKKLDVFERLEKKGLSLNEIKRYLGI